MSHSSLTDRGLAETSTFLFDVWHAENSAFMAGTSALDRLCLEVLRSTNHSIVVPVLARYYEEWANNQTTARKDEFLSVLRAVTAFWTLWRTSRATTKGIDDIHRKLMANGHQPTGLPALAWRTGVASATAPTAAQLRAALMNLLSTRGNIASKADWIARATVQPLYQTSNQLARFLLLAAHDDRVGDGANPGLIKRGVAASFSSLTPEVWKAHYSVEHMAPQGPATGDTSYEQALYDQGLVDRLGNLTLMPEALNPMLANKTWPYKRDIYDILSLTDPQARVAQMQQALPGLAPTTKAVLENAIYLPFCEFLSGNTAPVLTAAFINQRGQRLAELAVDRLWPMLA